MQETESVAPDTRTNEDLDKLADQTDTARNTERPMSTSSSKEETKTPTEDYEFIHNGKPVKGTREQILKWAQMGYDRPQFMQKFNQEKAKWDQERTEFKNFKDKYSPYLQVDDWAKANPVQWNKLQELWRNAMQNPGYLQQTQPQTPQNTQINPEIQPYLTKIQNLEHQLSQIIPSVQQFNDWRTQTSQKEEDSKLDQEIQSIREQYKDLDWTTLDQDGKSLEVRVLEHAQNNGIPRFQAAFRDLLHDELLNRAQAQAQQSVAKGIQTRTKLGILGESPMSQKGRELNRTKSIKDTSYEEITQEIFDELRRGKVS